MAPDNFLYNYQTLITGLLAVIAGAGAVWIGRSQVRAVHDQITSAAEQAERERAHRHRAARATLPATLNQICEYALVTSQRLASVWSTAARFYPDSYDGSQVVWVNVSVENFPPDLLGSLERVIETTDANDVAEQIESILRESQVLSARTRPLKEGSSISLDEICSLIIQSASIYARAETLFTYARKEASGVASVDLWERVDSAITIMGVHIAPVRSLADRRRKQGRKPGEADRKEPA